MKILVTGGRGMLGTDMSSLYTNFGHKVVVTGSNDLDVRDEVAVRYAVRSEHAEAVIHLAAMTQVDDCETQPDEAYCTNAIGTHNVALACREAGAKMVYVSTVAVFGGNQREPYTEFDDPHPISVYARSKYAGELAVSQLLNEFYIVRAGWLFGGGAEDKKFVARIVELAQERTELSIVNDKFGSPTYTRDLGHGILRLIETGLYGTYHMVNSGNYCSRYEYAQAILSFAGINSCTLHAVNSASFPLPAHRPRMEAARNYQLELRGKTGWMRPWRDALQEYVQFRLVGSEVAQEMIN